MNSALPVSGGWAVRKGFAEWRDSFRLHLRDRLVQSTRGGRALLMPLDADALSRLVVSVIWGMAVEAQSGATRKEIRAAGAALVALWPK